MVDVSDKPSYRRGRSLVNLTGRESAESSSAGAANPMKEQANVKMIACKMPSPQGAKTAAGTMAPKGLTCAQNGIESPSKIPTTNAVAKLARRNSMYVPSTFKVTVVTSA